MPYKEPVIKKVYYSIGEVAKMFAVSTSLLRYWEREFTIIKPKKNSRGNRLYTESDIEKIHLVFHLIKERGYKIDGAKELLKNKGDASQKKFEIISRLKKIRSFIDELNQSIK